MIMTLLNPTLVLYAVKSFLQVTIYALEVVRPNEARTRPRGKHEGSLSFRSFGDVCSIDHRHWVFSDCQVAARSHSRCQKMHMTSRC